MYQVNTANGSVVYEGSRAMCHAYIRQAIAKGSPPGFLQITPATPEEQR